jgi:hypothetical protein
LAGSLLVRLMILAMHLALVKRSGALKHKHPVNYSRQTAKYRGLFLLRPKA